MCEGRVRCPWHGACFNISNGDIEDFPGMDSLRSFNVEIENDNVYITVSVDELKGQNFKREKPMASKKKEDSRVFVVIGGGPSGATCAETLRQEGFTGKLVLISKEKHLPYDRPKLSKSLNVVADRILLRSAEFYQKGDIDVLLNCEVVELNSETKQLKLSNGDVLKYDSAFIATGAKYENNLDSIIFYLFKIIII